VVSTGLVIWMGNIKETYLRRDLAAATERAECAAERAAEANEAAEKERVERLKLQASVEPRDISAEDPRRIRVSLERFRGRLVSVRSYALDVEGSRLAQMILTALRASGIEPSDQRGNLFNISAGWNAVEGIQIAGPHSQDDLINALLKSPPGSDPNLKMFRKEDANIPDTAPVEILVGVKPIKNTP